MPALVLIHPDIPQNLGGILRLCACLNLPLHVIEPCGFPLDDARLRRSGMDYIPHAAFHRHASWEHFEHARTPGRLLLAETDGTTPLYDMAFTPGDYLLFGSESAGTPRPLYEKMDQTFRIPMRETLRSFNLAMSAGIVAYEAWRQLRWEW